MSNVSRRDVVKYLSALVPIGAVAAAATPARADGAVLGSIDEQRVKEFIASIKPAVILIEVETESHIQWGSGFFISSDGIAVTNRHVVKGWQKMSCLLKNKDRLSAKVLKVDEQYDLALIKVDVPKPVATVRLGDADVVHEGAQIAVMGYPEPKVMVYLGMALDSSTSRGAVNALRYGGDVNTRLGDRVLQIDAPVAHGNSGGPVFRVDTGEVIGVLSTGLIGSNNTTLGNNLTFAVPINPAKALLSGIGTQATSNIVAHDSKEAIMEPGNLRTLNTIGPTKELPPLFGYSMSFTTHFDEELTKAAINDWKQSTGQPPPRVAPLTRTEDQVYFGGTDGKFYCVDVNEPDDVPILIDASDDHQIFLYPPVITKDIVCAVSGSLDLSSEIRFKSDAVSMGMSLFGFRRGRQRYDTVHSVGKVYGLNRRNGNIDWQVDTNCPCTPVLYNGKVYYGGVGERGCLDMGQGTRQTFDSNKERPHDEHTGYDYIQKDGDKPFWNHVGYAGELGIFTIVVPMGVKDDKDGMYLVGREKAMVRAHDPVTGKEKWKIDLGEVKDHTEPLSTAMFVDEQKKVIYALAVQSVAAINAETGTKIWELDQGKEIKAKGNKRDQAKAKKIRFTPGMVISDGIIYIGSTDKKLHAINDKGEELWVYNTRGSVGFPTFHEGQVLFGSTDKYIHVVDAKTGALNWRVRISSPVRSRVLVHSGMVYAPTEDGSIYTLRLPMA